MNELEERLALVSSKASLDDHFKREKDGHYQVTSVNLQNETVHQLLQNRHKVYELLIGLWTKKQRSTSAIVQKSFLKHRPTWAWKRYWLVKYYQDPGAQLT
jgi:hypothetical protein